MRVILFYYLPMRNVVRTSYFILMPIDCNGRLNQFIVISYLEMIREIMKSLYITFWNVLL